MSSMRRRLAPALVPLALLATACGATATGGGTSTPPATAASASAPTSATAATSATATPTPTPSEPGGAQRLLPGNRIVAFYGAADTPSLGVLGTASPNAIWPRLAQQAAAYRTAGTPVIPAYELITDVIQASPGADGDYEVQESAATIDSYLTAAHAHHAMLILDIQPGRTSFLTLAERLKPYLLDPGVGLALDPEWRLTAGEEPDQQIGVVSPAEINQTSLWLQQLVLAHHLPQKLLLIHQFVPDQVAPRSAVLSRASLAMVFNMDGFGGRAAKLSKYHYLAEDPRFGLGLKLFYRQDVDIFSPAQTIALAPSPDVVDYE
jgi:hypothetical protein